MKKIAGILLFSLISVAVMAQVDVTITMGSQQYSFSGTQIFNGNESESTYYEVEDGVLHYYLTNEYNGNYIQFIHTSCEIKALDLKDVTYKDYDGGGTFMYINAKKNAHVIEHVEVSDNAMQRVQSDDNIETTEEERSTFLIIVNDEDTGAEILAAIKRG